MRLPRHFFENSMHYVCTNPERLAYLENAVAFCSQLHNPRLHHRTNSTSTQFHAFRSSASYAMARPAHSRREACAEERIGGCPDNEYGKIVRLLILTLCRRDEIGSLEWAVIDKEARLIRLPGARTKSCREHVVPLSDAAVAILDAVE